MDEIHWIIKFTFLYFYIILLYELFYISNYQFLLRGTVTTDSAKRRRKRRINFDLIQFHGFTIKFVSSLSLFFITQDNIFCYHVFHSFRRLNIFFAIRLVYCFLACIFSHSQLMTFNYVSFCRLFKNFLT